MKEKSARPLRILCVVNVPWDERLGAARVWMELGREWQRTGHTVEKYSLEDAFPKPTASGVHAAFRLLLFPRRVAAFIRRNRERFDVVDCLIGTVPFRKSSMRFRGLLVARSVGLFHVYDRFTRGTRSRPRFTLSSLFFAIFDLISRRASYRSLEVADLINVPNDEEAKVIVNELHCRTPAIVQPYGLTSGQLDEFSQVASSASDRLLRREVCFVGMWSVRKGARDWGAIARAVRAGVPDARFLFLGTMVEEATLLRDLALDDASFIALVPQYAPNELPQLLASATVGAFPSYVEGFGLGVIEQLAAGIPTVAYDIPGPRGILAPEFPEMLTPLGDIDLFAAAIVKLLKTGASEYDRLSAKARARAANFRWDTIAAETVEHYAARLPRT